jgi:hypothetical protein
MFIPAFGIVALLWSGLVEEIGALMLIEHVAMPLRREEYSSGAHGHGQVQLVAA